MIKIINSLPEMVEAVALANSAANEADRVSALCGLALEPDAEIFKSLDPFSDAYRDAVLNLYLRIAGQSNYNPSEQELSPYLEQISDTRPGYYLPGRTELVGDILAAMGSILREMGLREGQRLLEYGAGEGGIALEAAKCGVDVTVVDIEQRYLSIIQRRAARAEVNINTIQGEFGCDAGGKFDVVLFYEAFHHAIDHFSVACKVREMLNPGGRLILSGEPVIGLHNEQWKSSVPYPWGLRMDGLSFRAIQTYGWMELGFEEGYFIEMLKRAGYNVDFRRSLATDRANCYVATIA